MSLPEARHEMVPHIGGLLPLSTTHRGHTPNHLIYIHLSHFDTYLAESGSTLRIREGIRDLDPGTPKAN